MWKTYFKRALCFQQESVEKKYFELKPSASHLLNNQQLGLYSGHQLQQFLSGPQLVINY